MLYMSSRIRVLDAEANDPDNPKVDIKTPTSVVIDSSRNTFTDTAKCIFANKLRNTQQGARLQDFIKIGDPVIIELGYNGDIRTEFEGYVSKVNPDSPLTMECEDEMFVLKRTVLEKRTFKAAKLQPVIDYLFEGENQVQDLFIGDLAIGQNVAAIDVIDALRKNLKLFFYFKDKVLFAERLVSEVVPQTITFDSNKNVPQGTEKLKYIDAIDGNVIAKAVSKNINGTSITRYAFYKDNIQGEENIVLSSTPVPGNINTFNTTNNTQAQLDEFLTTWLPNLWYTGITGTISTFGVPSILHGDVARIVNGRIPGRDGDYRIVSIKKEYTTSNGYKQTAQLGRQIK